MAKRPIVLVHGYSDVGGSFDTWRGLLAGQGYDAETIHLGNYVSLSSEITIKDIAEGFDRALRVSGLRADEPFDAIVHSTGMLVVREWLAGSIGTVDRPEVSQERQRRLKTLIGLAPATFGSPMAHKGRSWLGAVFKGGKEIGPDFMEAGDRILSGLELGSRYTWDLAHRDFLADTVVYGNTSSTPFPFIFMGLKDYGWLKRAVTEPGTDGTVRWAGAGFNVRKVKIDLTVESTRRRRVQIEPWKNAVVPLVFVPDLNHGSILQAPSKALVQMVFDALQVSTRGDYERWATQNATASRAALANAKAKPWQQFVVRAIDERGDGISDFFVEVGTLAAGRFTPMGAFDLDVHAYRDDRSFRSFHVDLSQLPATLEGLAIRVIASSGTDLVGYQGFDSTGGRLASASGVGKWDAVIEFDPAIGHQDVKFFFPYTTTLVELRMNREPMPLAGVNKVFQFLAADKK